MGIYKIVNDLKQQAINIPTCSMASYGDISLYENRPVLYPFVNIDVVSNSVVNNGSKRYIFRIYCIDRNEPYIAYNKSEQLLNNFLNSIEVSNYQINYFTLNFKDVVNGVYADVVIDSTVNSYCPKLEDKAYIILENGDYLAKYLLNEQGGKTEIDN